MPIEDKNLIILQTATKHFAEKGYEGARVDEIAEQAGVNKATLYYRIGNKQVLYQTIFNDIIEYINQQLVEKLSAELNPEKKLKIYIAVIANTLHSKPETAPLILREVAKKKPDISQKSIEHMIHIRKILERILDAGVEQKIFKQTNPYLIHMLIIGTLNFYAASRPFRLNISRQSHSKLESNMMTASVIKIADDVARFILNSISLTIKKIQ